MKNLVEALAASSDVHQFSKAYFQYICNLLTQLDTKAINAVIDELENAYANHNTIFFVGNGGSAATASHMANDIGLDIYKKSGCDHAFRALSLTDNASVMTAIANDTGYENLFINQLKIHFRSGDKLIAISASGNSPNVVGATEWVRKQGGTTIGFTGFDGGKLKEICDITIHVNTPQGEYGPVEDIHLILDHLIILWLQHKKKER